MDIKTMAKALGLDPETATEEQVLARAAELATASAEAEKETEETEEESETEEEETVEETVITKPGEDGTVVVDAQALAAIKAKADRADAFVNKAEEQERDAFIENAWKRDGKFPEARAAHYVKLYNADKDGTVALINSLEKGLVPVNGQQSHVLPTDGTGGGADNLGYPSEWLPELQQG